MERDPDRPLGVLGSTCDAAALRLHATKAAVAAVSSTHVQTWSLAGQVGAPPAPERAGAAAGTP
jgi:hypothetical protein